MAEPNTGNPAEQTPSGIGEVAPPAVAPAEGTGEGNEAQAPNPAVTPAGTAEPRSRVEPPLAPAWARQRIDELTGARRREEAARVEAERERDSLRAQLAQREPSGVATPPSATPSPFDPRILDAEINSRAAMIQFNRDCDAVAAKGTAEFGDFPEVMKNYGMLGGLSPAFLEAVLVQDEPHKLLYELGKNPDVAQRMLGMSGPRLGAEMARYAAKSGAKPSATTGATPKNPPEPIPARVGGSATSGNVRLDDDRVEMSAWISARNAELKARRRA